MPGHFVCLLALASAINLTLYLPGLYMYVRLLLDNNLGCTQAKLIWSGPTQYIHICLTFVVVGTAYALHLAAFHAKFDLNPPCTIYPHTSCHFNLSSFMYIA